MLNLQSIPPEYADTPSMSPPWFFLDGPMGTYRSRNAKRKLRMTKGDWFLIGIMIALVAGISIGAAMLGRALANV